MVWAHQFINSIKGTICAVLMDICEGLNVSNIEA